MSTREPGTWQRVKDVFRPILRFAEAMEITADEIQDNRITRLENEVRELRAAMEHRDET